MTDSTLPAWSASFLPDARQALTVSGPLAGLTREWAWGGSTGRGVRVAVIDSGIEADHPALGQAVRGGVVVEVDRRTKAQVRLEPEAHPRDFFGHGTACAGIIHAPAPEAELYSVRVFSRDLSSKGLQFAGGLRWAIENGMQVVNLSLSTSRAEFFGLFHELADDAYFKNLNLVSAVNNIPAPSYPSLYSSVISVAAHEGHDPFTYYYNPTPPVEFGAPGIDVEVAWIDKSYAVSTGNSFAAPPISALLPLTPPNHPQPTPL